MERIVKLSRFQFQIILSLLTLIYCGWQMAIAPESDKALYASYVSIIIGWWLPSPKQGNGSL